MDFEDSNVIGREIDTRYDATSNNLLAFLGNVAIAPGVEGVSSGREVGFKTSLNVVQIASQRRLGKACTGIMGSKDGSGSQEGRSKGLEERHCILEKV